VKRTVIAALVGLAATACLDLGGASRVEVTRVTSPSGHSDAVVIETNGGATTSFGYEVHIVLKGTAPSADSEAAFLYGAVRNDHAYGVNLRWLADDALAVEYLDAKQVVQQRDRVVAGKRRVTITLVAGVRDAAAPPGGMLYNLERGRRR